MRFYLRSKEQTIIFQRTKFFNKMKQLCLATLLFVSIFSNLNAQQKATCGMSRADLDQTGERLLHNRANAQPTAHDRAIQYVPVRFIVVGNDDGSGYVSDRKILELLCSLNDRYAPLDMRFYLIDNDFKTINSTEINLHQSSGLNIAKMNSKKSSKAINYFITDVCDYGNNPNGNFIILGYYTPDKDWLVIRQSEVNALSSTVAHETGHFFSLLHPFNGWDHTPWTAGSTACAPTISPEGVAVERVDGANSLSAGDFIADTKPSYDFLDDDPGCSGGYTGGAKDPLCVPLAGVTLHENYMDYFENCSTYSFTADQIDAIQTDLNSNGRNFLDNTYAPPALTLTAPSDILVSPVAGAVTPYNDKFTFTWNAVSGATLYLLEVGVAANSLGLFAKMVSTTSYTATIPMNSNLKRYWRITPLNNYYTCLAGASAAQQFITGPTSATVQIEGLNDWHVTPNPISTTADAAILTQADCCQ